MPRSRCPWILLLTIAFSHAWQGYADSLSCQSDGVSLAHPLQANSLLQASLARQTLLASVDENRSESNGSIAGFDDDFWDDYIHDNNDGVIVDSAGTRTEIMINESAGDFLDIDYVKDDNDDISIPAFTSSLPSSSRSLCWSPPEKNSQGDFVKNHVHKFAPINVKCPAECPYTQELADEKCYKACVRAQYCRALHPFKTFGDKASLQCSPTCGSAEADHIVGCSECAAPGVCKKCSIWRTLRGNGRICEDYWTYMWSFLHYLALGPFLFFLVFMVYLQLRPILSPDMLARANLHRQLCKPWQFLTKRRVGEEPAIEVQRFPLLTKTHEVDIGGIGYSLYFRWLHLLLIFSMFLSILCYFTFCFSFDGGKVQWSGLSQPDMTITTEPGTCKYSRYHRKVMDANGSAALVQYPSSELIQKPSMRAMKKVKVKMKLKAKVKLPVAKTGKQAYSDVPAGDAKLFPLRMARAMIFAYVVLLVFSVWYCKRQAQFGAKWRNANRQHSDYAVFVTGLPEDATDPDKLRVLFQSALENAGLAEERHGHDVVGVSIAYDPPEHSKYREYFDKLQEKIDSSALQSVWSDPEISSSTPPSSKTTTSVFTRPLEKVVYKLLPRDADEAPEDAEDWEEQAKREFLELRGSGSAYVVLASERARACLLSLKKIEGPNRSGQLVLKPCSTEPPAVIWEAHSHVPSWTIIAKNLTLLAGAIFAWAALFTPYAFYHMTAEAVPGDHLSEAADFVLGMMIALGNQLVTYVIDINVRHFGIKDREVQEATNMSLVYIATMINTGLDICIVLVALRGISLDMAMHGTLDQTHYDRVMAEELYALIIPGYLLTPYFIAPVVEDIIPRFMKSRLVRSTTGVSRSRAELKYMAPTYDLSWHYSDLLTNISVCLPLLFFETHQMYKIFAVLVCCNLLNYTIDHFRLLRATTDGPQLSQVMDIMFCYLWAIPLGFLGSIALHWACAADLIEPDRSNEKWYELLFLPVHCVLYIALARWARKKGREDANRGGLVSYEAMAAEHWSKLRFYDYFNTNTVQVLRSWLLDDTADPKAQRNIIPYILGKEHLLLLNPQIAQHDVLKLAMSKRLEAARPN
mmetsp:Transcript_43428/g.68796  ORF Transcript_43428/g.68796 Transcript_43428/m.68796 type:complete len:1090 (+) Transcript_43428:80-3349(+)